MDNFTERIKVKNLKRNTSLSLDVLEKLTDCLGYSDFAKIFKLIQYVDKDNIISIKGKPIKYENELVGIIVDTPKHASKLFKAYKDNDVIKVVKNNNDKFYLFNPWIYSHSYEVSICVLKEFEQSIWKTVLDNDVTDRNSYEYALWEHNVFKRDGYKCICCGSPSELEAHHVIPYSTDYEKRLDVSNGVTLCKRHHNSKMKGSFHNIYGTVSFGEKELYEYINEQKLLSRQ